MPAILISSSNEAVASVVSVAAEGAESLLAGTPAAKSRKTPLAVVVFGKVLPIECFDCKRHELQGIFVIINVDT